MAEWAQENRWTLPTRTEAEKDDPLKALINRLDSKPGAAPKADLPTGSPAPQGLPLSAESKIPQAIPHGLANPLAPSVVIVDKAAHQTHIFQKDSASGQIQEVFSTKDATGKNPAWTPVGRYTVVERQENPWWVPPANMHKHKVAPGPNNPLGPRKLRLADNLGRWTNIEMHGTNDPDALGTNVSHGCIRHSNEAIVKMYPHIKMGTPVYITDRYDPARLLKESDFQR